MKDVKIIIKRISRCSYDSKSLFELKRKKSKLQTSGNNTNFQKNKINKKNYEAYFFFIIIDFYIFNVLY